MCRVLCGALFQQSSPIIGGYLIQCLHYIVEFIRNNRRWPALSTMKLTTKIVERFLPMGQLTNFAIDLKPDEYALSVVIEAAPPILGGCSSQSENLYRPRCIFKRTPGSPCAMVQHRSGGGQLDRKSTRLKSSHIPLFSIP